MAATLASTMLSAALEYAERCVPVFPVWGVDGGRCRCGAPDCRNSAGKHPIASCAPRGFKDASIDESVIREWWSRFPSANIATPTGDWCDVLDIDPRNGGDTTLLELERQHGPLPDTATVITGGGGRHIYFSATRVALGKTAGRGIDIKTAGGYVLLPPSNHVSGGIYRDDLAHLLFETPLAPVPTWLVALATAATVSTGKGHHAGPADWPALLSGVTEGQRHAVAARLAGHLLGKGLSEAEVEVILCGYADRCIPPMPAAEVRRIVHDLAAKDLVRIGRNVAATTPATDDLGLTPLNELLNEPAESHEWIVEGRLPAGGFGGIFGKPKGGKSTLARTLAVAVARGTPWLGMRTTPGPVIYLALEEKRGEVREHFRALGATGADQIFILVAPAPLDALQRLRLEVARRRPALVIIDPLFRMVRVDDGNNYALMTSALEPLLVLARET